MHLSYKLNLMETTETSLSFPPPVQSNLASRLFLIRGATHVLLDSCCPGNADVETPEPHLPTSTSKPHLSTPSECSPSLFLGTCCSNPTLYLLYLPSGSLRLSPTLPLLLEAYRSSPTLPLLLEAYRSSPTLPLLLEAYRSSPTLPPLLLDALTL